MSIFFMMIGTSSFAFIEYNLTYLTLYPEFRCFETLSDQTRVIARGSPDY